MRALTIPMLLAVLCITAQAQEESGRWPLEKANAWYERQPWLVGCNFIPSTAINQLEMWQADTFDPKTIDRELGWAEDLGFNVVRVYLHDLAYEQDPDGFLGRMDRFLSIAKKHGIKPLFVIFDDCWLTNPSVGKQPEPWPGVHNSGWVQSPGVPQLKRYPDDPVLQKRLETYVKAVLTRFKDDERVLMWDLYNEASGYWRFRPEGMKDISEHQGGVTGALCLPLLKDVWQWAREVDPAQPLTVCYFGIPEVQEIALRQSDIFTFHHYSDLKSLDKELWGMRQKEPDRPMICTEYLARHANSKFQTHLPVFRDYAIGAINWGFVSGKTQTIYPWDSWKEPGKVPEPDLWFHDILRKDGSPYDPEETVLIKKLTSEEKSVREAMAQRREEWNGRMKGVKYLRLEDLDLSHVAQGWGKAIPRRTILHRRMSIAGVKFDRGVSTHAISRWTIDLKGAALAFQAMAGLDDEVIDVPAMQGGMGDQAGSVAFLVYADQRLVYDSGPMRYGEGPKRIDVDLKGVKRLDLIVNAGGDTIDCDHANWAEAVFILDPDATETPESVPRLGQQAEILTPAASPAPRINAPGAIGAGPHREFLYYVPIAGQKPMKIGVRGLPKGLSFDKKTGIIRGYTSGPAEYVLKITAKNRFGKDRKSVRLQVGSALTLTPPMGWNSWNCWGTSVDEEKMKAAADALVETGLIDHGWTFVNIDDAWHGERHPETGEITSNEKFPDMKALADYIHSKGLKFGLYTDAGTKTCAGFEGSKGHEFIDARTYAEWGVDYVKVDWCYSDGMDSKEAYPRFGQALEECGRDIVFSICNWGVDNPWEWAADAGGNLWRTTGDIVDTWSSVYTIIQKNAPLYPYARPGHWNDPDMLVVGRVGWGPSLRESRLTANQQYCHISLWCLSSSPLILGCDLTQLDDFTRNLLTNDEVLAINQDTLGKQGRMVIQKDGIEVWMKDLADGSKAIGIFNLAPAELDESIPRDYSLSWESIGLAGPLAVRDLWRQKDLGVYRDAFPVGLPECGVSLIKVTAK